jgi:endonuclease YncB( thermonuclease family)
VLDGDTLVVAGKRVRLFGIDAPELDQLCVRDGRTWPCGREAKEAMQAIVHRERVDCHVQEINDRYGRVIAHCKVGDEDIAARMVSDGMATAYRRYSDQYVGEEEAARREHRGLWAGWFERPEDWRRRGRR